MGKDITTRAASLRRAFAALTPVKAAIVDRLMDGPATAVELLAMLIERGLVGRDIEKTEASLVAQISMARTAIEGVAILGAQSRTGRYAKLFTKLPRCERGDARYAIEAEGIAALEAACAAPLAMVA